MKGIPIGHNTLWINTPGPAAGYTAGVILCAVSRIGSARHSNRSDPLRFTLSAPINAAFGNDRGGKALPRTLHESPRAALSNESIEEWRDPCWPWQHQWLHPAAAVLDVFP